MATGTVRQIIEFKGQDDASAVADKVRKSVQGIAGAGDKAASATARINAKGLQEIQQKSGDVESALKGISDFAGDAKGQVSQLGDSFGAVEGIMRLLPGPIGLATTAVAGLVVGAKLLSDYISQSAAKAQLLTTGLGNVLAEELNLGAEGAIKLSQALGELGDKALRPSDLLLRQVADNARKLGQDPAENVTKFIAAWKEGPEAIAKVEREIGKLTVSFATIADTASNLGLDADALGLKAAVGPAEQVKTALTEVSQVTAEIAAAQNQVASNEAEIVKASVVRTSELFTQNKELKNQIQIHQVNLNLATQQARDAAAQIDATKVLTQLEESRARGVQAASIQAQLANDKQAGQKIRLASLAQQQDGIEFQIAQILRLQGLFGDKFAAGKVEALTLSKLQLDVQRKQISDADAAERKAAASASAAKAKAARDAKNRERDRFAAEEVADLAAQEKTSKDLTNESIRNNIKSLEDQAQAQQRLVEARIGGTEDPADKARLEIANVEAQKLRELDKVREDMANNEVTRQAGKARLQAIQIEATSKVVAIQNTADAQVKAKADEAAKAQRDAATAALDIVGTAARAAQAYAGPNGLAGAMGAAATQAQALIASWSKTESNTSGIISAVGNVAAAVVDGEREKAGILAITEGAQAVALAFVPMKQAEAAGHAAAALLYAGVATGLIGGGAATSAGAAPGGLTTTTGTTAQGQQQGAGSNTVINFIAPLATKYEIGKSVVEAQKAAKAYAKSPMGV